MNRHIHWPSLPTLFLLFLMLAVAIGLPGCNSQTDTAPPSAAGGPAESIQAPQGAAAAPAPTRGTADEVLKRMIQAYKSAGSYRDDAIVQLSGTKDGQTQQMAFPDAVVMQRPNKIRMQIDGGTLLCDGSSLYGFTGELANQVLKLPAPPQLTIASLYPDVLLARSMMQSPAQSFSWVPLQLVLLLANDPMKTLTLDTQAVRLLAPENIDTHACDRVELATGNGPGVLWIDQATSVLRRFELPLLEGLRQQAEANQILDPHVSIEFRQAELNPSVSPEAFQFQLPDQIKPADALVRPILQILGQPCPDFQFTGLDGSKTSLSSLKDKVVVMQLWTSKNVPCRPVLQASAKAYAALKNPADVALMAVNLEGDNVQNETLQTVLKEWQAELPVYRDLEQAVARHFGIGGVPVTIVLDKKGNIQSLQAGELQNMDSLLAMLIERLQRGEDVYKMAFTQSDNERKLFQATVQQSVADDIYCLRPMIPPTSVSPHTEPANLKMTRLWSCDRLKHPGNITILPAADGSPRILVLDAATSLVELKTDGTVASTLPLQLQERELVTALRTALAGDGKRFFLGCARGTQRVHVFDENLKTLLAYPDTQHPGIVDAQLADINGDGKLEMILGYADVAGVHAVDLQGNRIWADRSMSNALRVAVLAPDSAKQCSVLAMNGSMAGGTLVQLDSQGKRIKDISIPDCSIGWVVAEDLDANGSSEICVLAVSVTPDNQPASDSIDAMGIDLDGQILWRHPMPRGVHQQGIEPVVAGNVLAGGPSQWLIAAADSTISIVAADGRLVDRFAYGTELAGMTTTQWNGKPVLLVSTPKTVDAWQIEPAAAPTPQPETPAVPTIPQS